MDTMTESSDGSSLFLNNSSENSSWGSEEDSDSDESNSWSDLCSFSDSSNNPNNGLSRLSPEKLIILLDNKLIHISETISAIRKFHKHEILQGRSVYGEYHHLFPILRKYPDKFYSYTRMKPDTFNYILEKISKVMKEQKWCNLHNTSNKAEERLIVTLR